MESKYDYHEFFHHKKPTNYDFIRNMSIEELAEWISCNCIGDGYGNSEAEWLEWLKEDADA